MAFIQYAPGSTSKSVKFFLRDSVTAQGKTGLASGSAGASASYTRAQATATSITLSDLAAADSAYSSGGIKEVSSSLAPGVYRLDVPDAALASGVDFVVFNLQFDGTLDEGLMVLLQNPTNNVGAGSVTYTVCVTDSSSTPIAGAAVWVSTDSAGSNVIAGAIYTDASGNAVFLLDPGSYFLWVQAETYSGTNPTTITVS